MALVGTDTSSLLEILKGSFGHLDLATSVSTAWTEKSAKKSTIAEKTSEDPQKKSVTPSDDGGLATVELIFPLKSIPLIIAGLPKSFLPLCGPETLSHYDANVCPALLNFCKKQLHAITFNVTILM